MMLDPSPASSAFSRSRFGRQRVTAVLALLAVSALSGEPASDWTKRKDVAGYVESNEVMPLDSFLKGPMRNYHSAKRWVKINGWDYNSLAIFYGKGGVVLTRESKVWDDERSVMVISRVSIGISAEGFQKLLPLVNGLPAPTLPSEPMEAAEDAGYVVSESLGKDGYKVSLRANSDASAQHDPALDELMKAAFAIRKNEMAEERRRMEEKYNELFPKKDGKAETPPAPGKSQ